MPGIPTPEERRKASLRREISDFARTIAHRYYDGFFAKVHVVLNEGVGVDTISECSLDQLGWQLRNAKTWLETGEEPTPGDVDWP